MDQAALARLLTITLAPQPGVADTGTQTLTAQDFDVRPVERTARSDKQTYLVVLRTPVPDGRIATLRLLLSDEPGLDDPIFSLPLHSAAPFKVTDAYCGNSFDHSVVDGVTRCDPSSGETPKKRSLVLQFSAMPDALDIVHARDALRFTPPLDDLDVTTGGQNELTIAGKFAANQVYALAIGPRGPEGRTRPHPDRRGRQAIHLHRGAPALAWDVPQGMVEALGPQMVPLRGHGYDRADIRIHPIDPLSRDFWPFPRKGLTTSDDRAPPLPGNEPTHYVDADPISGDDMAARINALGSPAISMLMDLPIHRGGIDAKFGLDLAPSLASIAGPAPPEPTWSAYAPWTPAPGNGPACR